MGAGVSHWHLANKVSRLGQLGVVSGTALDEILARRLQDGDPGGHMRRALDHFPFPSMAERVWDRFYLPNGRNGKPYQRQKPYTVEGPRDVQELLIVSNFVEVWLAREGHSNPVGINYLEKIQMPHLASMFGSMLAGVEYVLMGAGIPIRVPGVLDHLSRLEEAQYSIHVIGSREQETIMRFNPKDYIEGKLTSLPRPKFLAIISSNTLAQTLLKKANGKVDGFIIESPTAGGHNAPPRGKMQLTESGEPIYGERDVVDLPKMRELGAPFWLAGGVGSAHAVKQALADGAVGVQVGTAFAFCTDSGLREDYRIALVNKAIAGTAKVFTDPLASPTGFPFKVAVLEGTFSEQAVYEARPRICDLGYLREAYEKEDKTTGYRCPSEPVNVFVSKGGAIEETVGRKCVCNGLMANIGMQQTRPGNREEVGIITTGDDLTEVVQFLKPGETSYSAADVIEHLLSEVRAVAVATEEKVAAIA
jgi:nitronate monooxygenase